jgi:hypothetical protein
VPASVTDSTVNTPPEETNIYNSKTQAIFLILILLLWLAGGVFLIKHKIYLPGIILSLLIIAGLIVACRILLNKTPQLIIGDTGITSVKEGFHPWEDISEEGMITTGVGKRKNHWLYYQHPTGVVKMDISWFNIRHKALQQLLVHYRHQHNVKLLKLPRV